MKQRIGIVLVYCLCLCGAGAGSAHAQFTLSGTVTDPLAAPVESVTVVLSLADGTPIGILPTLTNVAGQYAIVGLPPENYQLRFEPLTATHLLVNTVPNIQVQANTVVNVSLSLGHILSGFVRDGLGVGIFDIDLNFREENTGDILDLPGDNSDATGFYDVVIPTGEYRINYRPVNGEPFIPVELRNEIIVSDRTINVTMLEGVFVSGTVTGPGGVPVVNADLDAVESATGVKLDTPGDNTDFAGNYQILIPTGVYDIDVNPLISDKLTSKIVLNVIVPGNMTLDFQVESGFLIDGLLRNPFMAGVANADIDVSLSSTSSDVYIVPDKTDLTGLYQFILPAGVFDLDYQPPLATGLAPVRLSGISIVGDLTQNVIAPIGVQLSGVVRNSFAVPVPGVDVDIKDAVTGVTVPIIGDNTDVNGVFTTFTQPGLHDLELEPQMSRRLAPVRFRDVNFANDTLITVALDTGMLVSGVVRDTNMVGIPGVKLIAVKPPADTTFIPGGRSDAFGSYTALLSLGTYDLLYRTDSLLGPVDSIILSGVVIGRDTTIDIIMGAGPPPPTFTISGTVTEQGAGAVANVDVSLLSSTGTPILSPAAVTDALGQYSFGGVTSDSYQVRFDAPPAAQLLSQTIPTVVAGSNMTINVMLVSCGAACGCCLKAGDANHDNKVNISDVTFLITRIFAGGAAPVCNDEADANAGGSVNIADVSYLISRIFAAGPAPICGPSGS